MAFTTLPSELLIQTFGYLDRVDLKSIRCVCRLFNETASPGLFERVLAAPRYKALGAFQEISKHSIYQTYVKEIIYDGSIYNKGLASSEHMFTRHLTTGPGSAYLLDSWGRRKRFKQYQQLYRDQEIILNDGILFNTLVRALESMPNVHTIIYSPGPRTVPAELKEVKDILPRGEPHAIQDRRRGDDERNALKSQIGFHALIGALGSIQYQGVHNFRVDTPNSKGLRGNAFTDDIFQLSESSQIQAGIHVFRQLHNMELPIKLRDGNGHRDTSVKTPEHLDTLRTLLAEAKEIKRISLRLKKWHPDPRRMYSDILKSGSSIIPLALGDVYWPKIRKINLGGLHAHEQEMLDLVSRHNDTLVDLEFSKCSLISGFWMNLVDVVKKNPIIQDFRLDRVNESLIGTNLFANMSMAEMSAWTYSGKLVVDYAGEKEFLPDTGSKSVYARRSEAE
ncbi:hypothetical protein K432DRAFT_399353 [Lepidopterella palustris CBS 459.81]|uniref:F-box domain-containing protein n=1 Tax=Lepidopterella palustris CBS 459.81 TaxID=1314670 RepID=A0A8E2EM99_9PEZI|nr:hypothetical protein K432DRAFT_399353 [Lepidopterella palustris CBS 459.81]